MITLNQFYNMDYIHSNGFYYTQEEIEQAAKKRNMSVQEYLDKTPELKPGKEQGSTVDPTMSQESMGSQLDDGSSDSVSWFDQTWFGRGIKAASTTGEATDLMSEDFSNIDIKTIQEFIKAKEQEARTYVESERMKKFQEQYKKEGSTWAAFFRGVKNQPTLIPELFVQSLGTQLGTAIDSPGASLSAAAAGAGVGAGFGGFLGAAAGAMGGLATSMEAALTFGELIEKELDKEGKEFTDKNIKELLEGPKGNSIRNKAIGRGFAIGTIEGFTGGIAGKAAVATKTAVATARAGKGAKISTLAGAGAGIGVEAVGGGVGEVAGRLAADQEMDPAEIGFEAITGITSAPINVGLALRKAKEAKYYLNDMKQEVSYTEFKNFVDTASDKDILGAKIRTENDATGIGAKAAKRKNDALIKSQIDDSITDQKDINELLRLSFLRDNAQADLKKDGVNKVPNAEKNLADIEAEINKIISKYEGAVDIAQTEEAAGARKSAREASVAETIAFAEAKGKLIGKDVKVVKDDKAAQELYDKLVAEGKAKPQNVMGGDGFIVGDAIIINEDVAGRTGAINVGAHELLHGVLQKHLDSLVKTTKDKDGNIISEDKTELKKFISDFKNFLSDKQRKWIENEIRTNYQKEIKEAEAKGENFLDTTDEWFTKFIDGIKRKEITYDESIFAKIKSFIERIFRKFRYNKEFTSGRQTYDFLKDFQQSADKFELSARAQAVAGGGTISTETKLSKSNVQSILEEYGGKKATKPELRRMVNETLTKTPQGQETFDITKSRFGLEIEPVVEAITKRLYDRIPSDATRAAGLTRADYKNALVSEAATMTQQEYNPAIQNLDTFISNRLNLRAESLAKRLGVQEKILKDVDFIKETDIDVVEQPTPKPKPIKKEKTRKTVVASKLGVKNKVDEVVKKQLPKLDVKNLTFKKIKNLVPEITGKLFGISPKKLKTLANITKPELQKAQMFISKNADLLLAMLPKGTTISGTSTGVPNTLLAAFYTKTAKAKLTKTGSRAGLPIQVKNKNITKKQFLEVFGIIDGVPVRTDRNTSARVLALANLTGKMMTNQAVRQNLELLGNSEQTIKNIREGASDVMFSKSNKIVKKHNLPDLNINDPKNGIENYNTFLDKMTLFSTFLPDKFIRRVDLYNFGISNQLVKLYAREQTKELNDIFLIGKNPDRVYQRPDTALGKRMKDITKAKVEKYNKTGSSNFNDMVNGIQKAIEANPNDKELHTAIFMYLSSAVNDTSHPMRAGAEYVGGDVTNTGGILYEHALQNANTRDEILDAILDNKKDFKKTMKSIKKNYKLIAMSIEDAATVDGTTYIDENGKAVKFKNGMGLINGKPWDLLKDNWFDRYFNLVINSIDPKKYKVFKNGKTFADEYSVTKSGKVNFSKSISKTKTLNKAVKMSRTVKPSKGITVLDFDDTLATTKSLVKYTTPDGKTGTLNAEEFASTYEDLQDQGYTFDFSDFNKVVKGKLAPLFNKAMKLQSKFGPENMFVLTARPPAAAKAIFDFLKANGLNIPLKNITGLGNSTAEAKALWIADKVGEGFNDFYFADDALQNVQAVKNMLDQFDVKSKVQQAKVKFSKSMNSDFNKILEDVTGIDAKKRFSDIKARKRGEKKGKFRLFIPPSHEDFVGLLYNFMGKGRRGDQHRNFFEQALVKPLNRAYREIDTAKQAIANDYKELNKQFTDVKKKLRKKTPDGDFIFEDAVRVYLWNKHGYDIPGLSETDQQKLVDIVMNDPSLQAYAETLNVISKQEKYVDPGKGWEAGNIQTDLIDATGRVGRAEYFTEFNENADILFSEENLNKIQAAYGKDFRSALEDMLHRISTGVNRPKGQHATINKFMNYLNGSVGTVMFFNVRSAILQQMSIVNYINFADNNIFAAAKAFANQKQYWADFAFIFNSDMLKQRRGGIGTDINGADLAQAVAGSKNPSKMVISYLLKIGFLPTQIGDNIAIATGGATFYRNRVNKYIKDGMSQKEAEAAAFTDFQDLTQSTQQSSRPDMTSQQQASWIGKLVLNFQNITSQYNRIIKKAASDIYNKRISPPYTTRTQSNLGNLSKILYYGGIQNVIFYSLQTALFAVMFDDDKDEDQILKKRERVIQGTIDSILRGSGIYGAIASTLKNTLIKFMEQREKGYNKDESAVLMELLNFSPVVGIKARQIVNAEKTINYNENIISEMETFDADNPQWSAVTNYTQALTNFPANRLYQKSINMRNALDKDYTNFQRVMFFSGYTTWSLGLGDNEAIIEAKEKAKINKKNTKKRKRTVKPVNRKRKVINR